MGKLRGGAALFNFHPVFSVLIVIIVSLLFIVTMTSPQHKLHIYHCDHDDEGPLTLTKY